MEVKGLSFASVKANTTETLAEVGSISQVNRIETVFSEELI